VIRRVRIRVQFWWRWHTKCRHTWFTEDTGSKVAPYRMRFCVRHRNHQGQHIDREGRISE